MTREKRTSDVLLYLSLSHFLETRSLTVLRGKLVVSRHISSLVSIPHKAETIGASITILHFLPGADDSNSVPLASTALATEPSL